MEKDEIVLSLLESKKTDSENQKAAGHIVDESVLTSRDLANKKQMKVRVVEISDENPPSAWKLGRRVKIDKILVTIKHSQSQQVEEAEFDIAEIERKIAKERHYSSTNRWVPLSDIKNGYIVGSRHTALISDAIALDLIVF